MKGIVFIILNEMVENQHGIAVWEEILDEVKPQSEGIYISTEEYPDEEVVRFVEVISSKLGLPSKDVTKLFGRYLFDELNAKMSFFSKHSPDLFDFLDSIENVVHKEVRKLYDSPNLPTIDCDIIGDTELKMTYHSPRKLCYLAEGLISGAADFYGDTIELHHDKCMHEGADKCLMRVVKINESRL